MPRIKREIVDGGIYHILNRGHNKDKIFAAPEDMSRLMKGICQSYANYYKMKYEHIGYLFQNRYKSILIDDDSYGQAIIIMPAGFVTV